jgi:hypothetical protein
VGRASTLLATNLLSTNITNGLSPLILPQPGAGTYNYYMASAKVTGNTNFNLHGTALDKPGAGTFYYTLWYNVTKVHLLMSLNHLTEKKCKTAYYSSIVNQV